jgi:hypothetical protein
MAHVEIQQRRDPLFENSLAGTGVGQPPSRGWNLVFKGDLSTTGTREWVSIGLTQNVKKEDSVFVLEIHSGTTKDDALPFDTNRFLESVYRLVESELTSDAIDYTISRIDDLLNDGSFHVCNGILRAADPEKLSDTLIVTFLGITLAAKSKLTSRPAFYMRSRQVVCERRGDDGADRLLARYQ